jgi:hypothetical protein
MSLLPSQTTTKATTTTSTSIPLRLNDTMSGENNTYIFRYSNIKRLFSLVCFIFVGFIGVFFIVVFTWLTVIFGVALVVAVLINIIDIAFFKSLSIDSEALCKEWYVFGKKSIKTADLTAASTKKLWEGSIIFRDKNRYGFQRFYMNFETFPTQNKAYGEVKSALIEHGVISGDEPCWNRKKISKRALIKKFFAKINSKTEQR